MNIDQARGINYKYVEVAAMHDLLQYEPQVKKMLGEYFKDSKDGTSNPDEMMGMLKERLSTDENFIMLVQKERGVPVGFLCGDKQGAVSNIIAGYIPPKLANKTVIDEYLTQFENWARAMGATVGQFYTFRTPGAHKFMLKRGWSHFVTVYKKEL